MAIDVQTLDQLDQTQVDQAIEFATQLLLEKRPDIDTKRGVFSELVIGLDGILNGAQRANISLERQSHSLSAITANPTLADDDIVDEVLSNFLLTRQVASAATGEVTIVLDQAVATTIGAGSIFEVDGRQYTADETYAARTDAANVLEDTDRLIVQLADDRYAFTISVTASDIGASGLLVKDTELVPVDSIASLVIAYATSDFTGGLSAQTNSDLIALLAEGTATRAWSNRASIPAMIRSADSAIYAMVTTAFPNILTMSITGHGDIEQQRDQHWLFPVSGGGRCDLYLRSQAIPQNTALVKTATLIDNVDDGGIWQFSLTRDDAPGFYEVTKILVAGSDPVATGYEVTEDIRGLDLTGDIYIPDLETALEAAYSRYQAATIRFLDTDTAVADTDVNVRTQDYDVAVSAMPLVAEVQDFIGDRGIIWPAGDVVVKGAIPCDLSVNFEIQRRHTEEVVDKAAIRTALADYVNAQGFAGVLYASALARIIDENLPNNIDAGAIDLFGRIRRPDGVISYIRGDDLIEIPEVASAFTSGRTVIFVLAAEDVAISDVILNVPKV